MMKKTVIARGKRRKSCEIISGRPNSEMKLEDASESCILQTVQYLIHQFFASEVLEMHFMKYFHMKE